LAVAEREKKLDATEQQAKLAAEADAKRDCRITRRCLSISTRHCSGVPQIDLSKSMVSPTARSVRKN
jgi:hypothetical protein